MVGKDSWISQMRMKTSSTQSAEIAGKQSNQQSDGAGDDDRRQSDHQRDARTVDDPAENVAAERIRAEPEGDAGAARIAGRLEPLDQLDGGRIVRRDPGGRERPPPGQAEGRTR